MFSCLVDKNDFSTPLRDFLGLRTTITVVDIGANPIDESPPYKTLLKDANTRLIGFEPNKMAFVKLSAAKSDNETYLPFAVADGGVHTLHICVSAGMTSLLKPNPAVLALFTNFSGWGQILRTEQVETVRLDDVPETVGMDMLKIDIQGGELMVFENAIERLKKAVVIQTEVEFMELYINQPLFADVDRFMRQHGFMLHRFDPIYSRDINPVNLSNEPYTGHSQFVWGDAIYIKDIMHLERLDSESLLRIAVILCDCYRSFDVVLYLLREYDRRMKTKYAEKFFNAITNYAIEEAVGALLQNG